MRNWKALGQAFADTGTDLMHECKNMEMACEIDEAFERMYILYEVLLDMLEARRKFIHKVFDGIDGCR